MITIENKKQFSQKAVKTSNQTEKKQPLNEVLVNHLKEKNEYNEQNISEGDKELSVKNLSASTLHNFLLKAEELGHSIQYETITRIKIV